MLSLCTLTLELGLPTQCTNGDVRLVDIDNGQPTTTSMYGGRVEICDNQTWKTVCDYRWANQEAMVVCRQLNYTGNISNG